MYVDVSFLGQGREVHVNLGGQGRVHQADINTRRAAGHDVSPLVNDIFM